MGKSQTDSRSNNKSGNSKDKSGDSSSLAAGRGDSKSEKLELATSINICHILCEKHSKIETILEQLANGGKFDAVARELSEDKARQGGSLRWKTSGPLLKAFDDAAYALTVSMIGRPVYVNPAMKTSKGPPPAVLRCAARFMLTPWFQVKYHCEFSQRFLGRWGEGQEVTNEDG